MPPPRRLPWRGDGETAGPKTERSVAAGGWNPAQAPHIESMAQWQASFKREPSKTKAELREMLTAAVRNTQPGAEQDQGPKDIPRAEGKKVRS